MKFKHLAVTGAIFLASAFGAKAQKVLKQLPSSEDAFVAAYNGGYMVEKGTDLRVDVSDYLRVAYRLGYDLNDRLTNDVKLYGRIASVMTTQKADTGIVVMQYVAGERTSNARYSADNLIHSQASVYSNGKTIYNIEAEKNAKGTFTVKRSLPNADGFLRVVSTETQTVTQVYNELLALRLNPETFVAATRAKKAQLALKSQNK